MDHIFAFKILMLLLTVSLRNAQIWYEAPEPYQFLHGNCQNCHPPVKASPDPLVAMTWSLRSNTSQLQIYRVDRPVRYWVSPPNTVEFVVQDRFPHFSVVVFQNCTITFDWGVERAAWMELISAHDLTTTAEDIQVLASISEFNEPYPGKTKYLTKYGDHTYRLETNQELYEGMRFSFLHFKFFRENATPITISNLSIVAKIKPINYTGSFSSSDAELTRTWYTGAYGVRLNMEEDQFNSILIERGDRVAIQGDGHPTIDAALVAFSSYDLIRKSLFETDSSHRNVVDDYIMAYPLYWCLSVMDYFMATGDLDTVQKLIPDIMILLNRRIEDFLDPNLDITWFGWDDRLGNGWCFHKHNDRCSREALLAFVSLVIRVCNDFRKVLRLLDMPLEAQKYQHLSNEMTSNLRRVPEWPLGFGIHSATNAITAGIPTRAELNFWMNSTLNDSLTVCSFSQFNQYWILQGFGNADRMEHALASIKLCWGPMLKLGNGCFWEVSSPEWVSFMKDGDLAPHLPSYCHPWSSGVTAWLSHVMGGIQPLLPGYAEFLAAPYVSLQYHTVHAAITTPHGKITVNATLSPNGMECSPVFLYRAVVTSPTRGIFGIRTKLWNRHGEIKGVLHDLVQNDVVPGTILSRDYVIQLLGDSARTQNHLYLPIEESGTHTIKARYRSLASCRVEQRQGNNSDGSRMAPFPDPKYPTKNPNLDRDSQGDGLFRYGREGYLLLGCDSEGNDVNHLPWFISNITIRRHGFPGWLPFLDREFVGVSMDNPVYLPLYLATNHTVSQRALGMVGLDDGGGGDINCIFVDIVTVPTISRTFSVSLYLVAKSNKNQHAIRVMDLQSLNIIAPTLLISNYERGVWWTVEYNKSIRLKFMNMKGIHLSAIAFASDMEVS